MSDDRNFERTARTWLELGPSDAPERAVEAALLAIETTPQERALRIPWRFHTMNTPARVAVAAVIGVLLVGSAALIFGGQSGNGVGGRPSPAASPAPSGTPAPSASGQAATPTPVVIPPLAETYISPTKGYRIDHPAGWTVTGSTADWPAGANLQWGDPALDELSGPGVRLVATSQAIPAGQTADSWLQAHRSSTTPCTGGAPVPRQATIDGQVAWLAIDGCSTDGFGGIVTQGGRIFDVYVVKAGRGYDFTLDGNADHAYFMALLDSIRLDPSSAVSATPKPSSSASGAPTH